MISKGDAVKIPPKSERDEDDIEANLLVPVGVTAARQRAKFIGCQSVGHTAKRLGFNNDYDQFKT